MTTSTKILLILILALTVFLHFGALGHGLPWLPQQDEFQVVERALAMGRGLPDPGLYTWPAGPVFYLNLLVFGVIYLGGHLAGAFHSVQVFANWYMGNPTVLYVASRGLSALWAVLAALCAFHLGRRLASPAAGLVAALAVALTPEWLIAGSVALPDAFAAAMVAVSLVFLLRAERRQSSKLFLLGCLFAGLAIAGKFHTWTIVFALPLTAGWLPVGRRLRSLLWGALLMVAMFVITNPFAVLKPAELADNLAQMSFRLYGTAKSFLRYDWLIGVGLGFALGLPLLLLSGLGFVRAFTRHHKSDMIILAFLIPFLLVVGLRKAPPKYLLPALVPLLALGAAALVDLAKILPRSRIALPALLVITMAYPAYHAGRWLCAQWQEDCRYGAARAILEHIQPGELVIVDEMPPDPMTVPILPDAASLRYHAAHKSGARGWAKARLEGGDYPFGQPTVSMQATNMTMVGLTAALQQPNASYIVLCDPDTPRWRAEANLEPGLPSLELELNYRRQVRRITNELNWELLYSCDNRNGWSGNKVEVWRIR
jgi:hypothetical protein